MATPLPPPTGQTALSALPQYGGAGGSNQAGQYYAGQEFAKLFGRNPTQSELDQFTPFYLGADPNIANVAGGNQAVSSYFNQQQQIANAPQQEADQIKAQIPIIGDLINQQMTGQIKNLTDPNSEQYKTFAGNLNNLGITPSSGAFQSGLGSAVGGAANDFLGKAIGAVGLPIAQTYAQGMTTPFTDAMSRPGQLFNHNLDLQDFLQQMTAANNLFDKSQPSDLQKGIGIFGGAGQGVEGLGKGTAALAQTSYVCKELIERGLLCESDMDDFHVHIMPALFKKGRAFWKYAMDGYNLVQAVNKRGLDWKAFKPLLFDRVMAEPDPCKAVDLYADACHQLCISTDRSLWDQRVYRTSIWDSLIFLPRLFTYTPFLEALIHCIRVKMLFIYDKPKCEVH
jgi:hypothetical protein